MKFQLSLIAASAMYFLVACNNGSDTSTTTREDSTVTADNTVTEQSNLPNDTTNPGNDLMKPIDDMMAEMQVVKMSGDFDIDFANMMIVHHQGAIGMSEAELLQGSDEKMKAKATEIISKQKEEQQKLRDFISSYKPSGMKHGEGELQRSMAAMSSKMKSMQMGGNVDKDFAMMMSSHHEDGVTMAKMELTNGMSGKLKQMAQKIITDQQKEIDEFKSWLSSHQ